MPTLIPKGAMAALLALSMTAGAQAQEGGEAEPQKPTGKFTTATEVRPILEATRGNWVAVRVYNGQDMVYFTHLLAWRCGLKGLRYAINGGAMQAYDLPPCHTEYTSPNALLDDEGMPVMGLEPGSVEKVRVELIYDDLSRASAEYARDEVLIP